MNVIRQIPRLILLLAVSLFFGCGSGNPPANQANTDTSINSQNPGESAPKNPTEAMKTLRTRAITTPVAKLGFEQDDDYPLVYGVLLEFPIEGFTATVVALRDGNASLYTTSTVGIIGGIAYENVRAAAKTFVKAAGAVHADAAPTTDYPYPESDRVRFYLLTYDGVRVIDTDLVTIEKGSNPYSELFKLGQNVLTQLRVSTQKQQTQKE